MSVKTKLARQAVRTTAKHTAHGAASKVARRPFRSVTLLALGAAVGFLAGRLTGRADGGGDRLDPIAGAPAPPNVAGDDATDLTARGSETGAAS